MTSSPPADGAPRSGKGGRHRDRSPRRSLRGLIVAAVVVSIALVGTSALWGRIDAGGSPNASVAHRAAAESRPSYPVPPVIDVRAVPARPARSQLLPQQPISITLASGTRVPITPVSTLLDGTLDAPNDITIAGWWDGGARLGDPYGAIVVAAHVDSAVQGLGPFSELLGARAGDRMALRSRELGQQFMVSTVNLVPKDQPAQISGLFSVHGVNRLVLITCAGPYDPSNGGYQSIAVVTAVPTGPAKTRHASVAWAGQG